MELDGKKLPPKQGDIHLLALKKMVSDFNISCRFIETDEYQTVFEMRHANYVDIGVVNRLYGNEKKAEYSGGGRHGRTAESSQKYYANAGLHG
jgi:hypothetical protein